MESPEFEGEPTPEQVERISRWLARAGYRISRPLQIRSRYSEEPPPEKRITAVILDTETTGIQPERDRLIELGMVFVELCPESGQVYRVLDVFDELEYPGMPIPPESTRIHHITDEMVAGKRIDDAEVESRLSSAALVIAHNAAFDRPFVEARFPCFAGKAWACSLTQIPWAEEGIGSAKLEFLAYACGFHFTGHRAATDCHALLEILQQPLPASRTRAMQALLENARLPEFRVAALSSPFESKDRLRERNYRWNADRKVWSKGVSRDALDAEVSWLREAVYAGRPFSLELEKLTAMNRFSRRPGKVEIQRYD